LLRGEGEVRVDLGKYQVVCHRGRGSSPEDGVAGSIPAGGSIPNQQLRPGPNPACRVESGSAPPGLGHRGLLGHEPYRLDEGNCRSMRAPFRLVAYLDARVRRRAVQGRSSWIDVPPYAARCRFVRRLSVHSGRQKAKARRLRAPCHSQCIAHRGACGKTRVVLHNLRPKPEPAEIRESRSACALVDVWASLNVEPPVGLAVRLRALGAEVRVCAPPDCAEQLAEMQPC
jgi:hypothetical protein